MLYDRLSTRFVPRSLTLDPPPRLGSLIDRQRRIPTRPRPRPAFAIWGSPTRCSRRSSGPAYAEPTPVQAGIIPRALAGVDVLGQARTGTGKTAAFAIPILERLKHGRKGAPPQALVLVPTRELAVQVRDEVRQARPRPHAFAACRLRRQADPRPDRQAATAAPTSSSARPAACSTIIGRGTLDLRSISNRRARRSRPHARHRLPPRHRKNPPPLPQGAADAAARAPRSPRRSSGWPARTCATRR